MTGCSRGSVMCGGVFFLMFLLVTISQADDHVFPDTVSITAGRSCGPDHAGPADTLVVTVTIHNAELDSLRSIYFSDHLPAVFFDVSTQQVRVNDILLPDTAYIYETTPVDQIFPGARSHRWIIEAPPDSLGSRPCGHILDPAGGSLQIVYAVRCTTNGQHCLPGYSWAAQLVGGDVREVFGYADSLFIAISSPPEAVDDLLAGKAGSHIYLCWSEPWDDMGIGSYVIFRDTVSDFTSLNGDSIAVTGDTFFVDVDGALGDPGVNRFYLVRAVDVTGKRSDDSNHAGEFDKNLGSTK